MENVIIELINYLFACVCAAVVGVIPGVALEIKRATDRCDARQVQRLEIVGVIYEQISANGGEGTEQKGRQCIARHGPGPAIVAIGAEGAFVVLCPWAAIVAVEIIVVLLN